MKITDLQNGYEVRSRIGRLQMGRVYWGPWRTAPIFVQKSGEYIKELRPHGPASFDQSHYEGQGVFVNRETDLYLEIDGMDDAAKTYKIVPATYGEAIKCLRCGMTSYHPDDVYHRYCANCKRSHGFEPITTLSQN